MKFEVIFLFVASCAQAIFGSEPGSTPDSMLVIYRNGVIYTVDSNSGKIASSINLELDTANLASWKLASGRGGMLFLTDLSRPSPTIYVVEVRDDGQIGMEKFADGCFPVFVGNDAFYFSLDDDGYCLVRYNEGNWSEPIEVHPGPFYPAYTFQGSNCFGFYDQDKSDYYFYTKSLGLEKLALPEEYAPVGIDRCETFVCFSESTSGTHYLDKGGNLVESTKHTKSFEKPLFYDENTGLLVVNRIYGSGFLNLTETEESHLIVDKRSVLVEVGPVSSNSVVVRETGSRHNP